MVSVLLHELEVHLPEDLPREVGDRIPDAVRGLLGRPNEPMLERRWAREYLLDALWEVGVDWAATFAEDVVAEAEALVKETKRQTATGGGE
ncbi:MAG: hypothetical protein U9R79_05895 [Armatimonadota bacterium]|nr:hypothetical protein [Armatimonadota bacterium]